MSPVIKQVDVFYKAYGAAEQYIKKQKIQEWYIASEMENWDIGFDGMAENKEDKAEKAKEQESIEYFRWFSCIVFTKFPECFVPVVQGQQRLDDTGHPEKSDEACNEHEHLPLPYLGSGKMAFCKYYAYNKKYDRAHQLE